MKKLLFLSLVFGIFGCKQAEQTSQPVLEAGVAAAPINPPVGAFIAGDKQNRRFTAVRDSLYAKAVVISQDSEQLAIVTIDCIGLLYPDVLQIRQRAAALCGIAESRIVVSSTHTHSGPDVVGIWGADYEHSGVASVYMEFLVSTAAAQVKAAFDSRRAATVYTAESTFGKPWVQNICDEEIDRSLTVMQFQDSDGKAIATLTNFACHPTFLDAKFSEVSSDFVSGYYNRIKGAAGGEALFLQGAIGGWVQPVDGEGTFEQARKRGTELADTVLLALENPIRLSNTAIRFASKRIRFPVENAAWKQLSALGTIKRPFGDSVETELSWFSIGEAQFATHPGETAPYYGLETKKLMHSGPRFVLGLGNDALGYIVKPSFFEDRGIPHAEYLTSMSLGKPTASIMMRELQMIIPQAER